MSRYGTGWSEETKEKVLFMFYNDPDNGCPAIARKLGLNKTTVNKIIDSELEEKANRVNAK